MERVSPKTPRNPYVGRVSLGAPPTLLEGPIAPLREAQPTEPSQGSAADMSQAWLKPVPAPPGPVTRYVQATASGFQRFTDMQPYGVRGR